MNFDYKNLQACLSKFKCPTINIVTMKFTSWIFILLFFIASLFVVTPNNAQSATPVLEYANAQFMVNGSVNVWFAVNLPDGVTDFIIAEVKLHNTTTLEVFDTALLNATISGTSSQRLDIYLTPPTYDIFDIELKINDSSNSLVETWTSEVMVENSNHEIYLPIFYLEYLPTTSFRVHYRIDWTYSIYNAWSEFIDLNITVYDDEGVQQDIFIFNNRFLTSGDPYISNRVYTLYFDTFYVVIDIYDPFTDSFYSQTSENITFTDLPPYIQDAYYSLTPTTPGLDYSNLEVGVDIDFPYMYYGEVEIHFELFRFDELLKSINEIRPVNQNYTDYYLIYEYNLYPGAYNFSFTLSYHDIIIDEYFENFYIGGIKPYFLDVYREEGFLTGTVFFTPYYELPDTIDINITAQLLGDTMLWNVSSLYTIQGGNLESYSLNLGVLPTEIVHIRLIMLFDDELAHIEVLEPIDMRGKVSIETKVIQTNSNELTINSTVITENTNETFEIKITLFKNNDGVSSSELEVPPENRSVSLEFKNLNEGDYYFIVELLYHDVTLNLHHTHDFQIYFTFPSSTDQNDDIPGILAIPLSMYLTGLIPIYFIRGNKLKIIKQRMKFDY